MPPLSRRRYARATARFGLIRRLTIAQGVVSVTAAALSLSQLQQLELATVVSTVASIWCGLAAWREYSAGMSRLLDPKLLSASVDHHLLRAVLAGAAVMLLSWTFVRGKEPRRRNVALMAVAMQVLATLCVTSMFVVRNAFNHIVPAGSKAESDVELSDVESDPPSGEPDQDRRAHTRALSQTLPRGWRQHAPHRQQWEPPCLPLLSSNHRSEQNLTTLEEEMSPCLGSPYDSHCEQPSRSPKSPTEPKSETEQRSRARASRSLSFGSRPGSRTSLHEATPEMAQEPVAAAPCAQSAPRRSPSGRMSLSDLRECLRSGPGLSPTLASDSGSSDFLVAEGLPSSTASFALSSSDATQTVSPTKVESPL